MEKHKGTAETDTTTWIAVMHISCTTTQYIMIFLSYMTINKNGLNKF